MTQVCRSAGRREQWRKEMTDGPACFPRAPFEDNCHMTVHVSAPSQPPPTSSSLCAPRSSPNHHIMTKCHNATMNLPPMTTVALGQTRCTQRSSNIPSSSPNLVIFRTSLHDFDWKYHPRDKGTWNNVLKHCGIFNRRLGDCD